MIQSKLPLKKAGIKTKIWFSSSHKATHVLRTQEFHKKCWSYPSDPSPPCTGRSLPASRNHPCPEASCPIWDLWKSHLKYCNVRNFLTHNYLYMMLFLWRNSRPSRTQAALKQLLSSLKMSSWICRIRSPPILKYSIELLPASSQNPCWRWSKTNLYSITKNTCSEVWKQPNKFTRNGWRARDATLRPNMITNISNNIKLQK